MNWTTRVILGASFCLVAGNAMGAAPSSGMKAQPYPESFRALMDCRNIVEASARLACFDQATATLAAAAQVGDIAVADKAQITEAKRGLFGFATQSIKIFASQDGKDDIDQIEDVVSEAEQLRSGQWSVTLPSGAVWTQVDTAMLAVDPKPGMKIVIRRAALGSFMARLGNQPAIRIRRVR